LCDISEIKAIAQGTNESSKTISTNGTLKVTQKQLLQMNITLPNIPTGMGQTG